MRGFLRLMQYILASALLLWLTLWPHYGHASSEYDAHFRWANSRYLAWHTGSDWYYLKAQCMQESLLDPRAVSHAGAQGICQFMPATWREVTKALGIYTSPHSPKANIIAAGFYMNRMLRAWTTERTNIERLRFAWGSYNYGIGNMLNAQKRAHGSTRWHTVSAYVPWETQNYIMQIERYHRSYK